MRVNHERELGGKRKQRRTKMGTNQMKDYKVWSETQRREDEKN